MIQNTFHMLNFIMFSEDVKTFCNKLWPIVFNEMFMNAVCHNHSRNTSEVFDTVVVVTNLTSGHSPSSGPAKSR